MEISKIVICVRGFIVRVFDCLTVLLHRFLVGRPFLGALFYSICPDNSLRIAYLRVGLYVSLTVELLLSCQGANVVRSWCPGTSGDVRGIRLRITWT